jgi:hypothetical protein
VVLLRVAEFENEPIVCIKDCHDEKNGLALRAGSIYVRTPDARSAPIESGEEMRALLDLAVQKRGDVLLGQIRGLVGHLESSNPKAVIESYQDELVAASEFFVPHTSKIESAPISAFVRFAGRRRFQFAVGIFHMWTGSMRGSSKVESSPF